MQPAVAIRDTSNTLIKPTAKSQGFIINPVATLRPRSRAALLP